jgi:hypothetical protein
LKDENGELIMKTSKIFLVLILMFNFGFGQNSLNKQLKKIITETEKRANAKITENGIDNKLWTDKIDTLKKGKTITFYTTSNIKTCYLKVYSLLRYKHLTIENANFCDEPTTISVSKSFYNYKIEKDYLRANPLLIDGGLYDNQGVHKLSQKGSSYLCNYVIVSDAGNEEHCP